MTLQYWEDGQNETVLDSLVPVQCETWSLSPSDQRQATQQGPPRFVQTPSCHFFTSIHLQPDIIWTLSFISPRTDMVLTSHYPEMLLLVSFLFLHDPLSIKNSSSSSSLVPHLFPSGEISSEVDPHSLEDTLSPTVNRWNFHSHSLGQLLLRAGAKMPFVQLFILFSVLSTFWPIKLPASWSLSPSDCELSCVRRAYFFSPSDRRLWSSGIDVSRWSSRLVVTSHVRQGLRRPKSSTIWLTSR